MEEEKKKTTLLFVFLTYLPMFLLKFRSRELIGCGIKFCIQRVPTRHTFNKPRYPKSKKSMKNVMMMSDISCFWGSGVCQKYAVRVLVRCGIKFRIQQALPIEIWVKTQGDMSKIKTQKVVFFFLPPKIIIIILLF